MYLEMIVRRNHSVFVYLMLTIYELGLHFLLFLIHICSESNCFAFFSEVLRERTSFAKCQAAAIKACG